MDETETSLRVLRSNAQTFCFCKHNLFLVCLSLTSPLTEKGSGAAEEGPVGEAGARGKTAAACPDSSSRRRHEANKPAAEPADIWRTAAGREQTHTHTHVTSLFERRFNVTLW